jgi:anaerobic C4-dicarboxylate transporter
MTIIRAKDFLSKLRSDPEFEKRLQREYEKLTKEERERKLKKKQPKG